MILLIKTSVRVSYVTKLTAICYVAKQTRKSAKYNNKPNLRTKSAETSHQLLTTKTYCTVFGTKQTKLVSTPVIPTLPAPPKHTR